MKTAEELNALKEEVEALNAKLSELSEEEIAQVAGGSGGRYYWPLGDGAWPYKEDGGRAHTPNGDGWRGDGGKPIV